MKVSASKNINDPAKIAIILNWDIRDVMLSHNIFRSV
jgi:hypothetical protein